MALLYDVDGSDTTVASVLGENSVFVGCCLLHELECRRMNVVSPLKLCQVTGQKQVLSYLQVVISGVLAAR